MMHMTIHWGTEVTLLFDSWSIDSWPSYLLTLLACFLFSAFYQYLEERRLQFKSAAAPTPLLLKIGRNQVRVATSVLFGISSAIGYLLMLIIMSFNGGVFLSVVLGLSVGYYGFRTGDEAVLVVDPCACF